MHIKQAETTENTSVPYLSVCPRGPGQLRTAQSVPRIHICILCLVRYLCTRLNGFVCICMEYTYM
jgi:hypothetical protein